MIMTVNDFIMEKARGSYDSWAAYVNQFPLKMKSYVLSYGEFVFIWGARVGVDPAIALAQSHVETFNLTTNCPYDSFWVIDKGNMVGYGIVGSASDAQSYDYRNEPELMAKRHIAHLSLYAKGDVQPPLTRDIDIRYTPYIDSFGARAMAPTIAGLSNNWAADDPQYAANIVARSKVIWPNGLDYHVVNTTYATPTPVKNEDGTTWVGDKDIILRDTIVYAQPRTITPKVGGQARINGTLSGAPTRARYAAGEVVTALGWFRAGADANGEDRYWVLADGARLHVASTVDKPITLRRS